LGRALGKLFLFLLVLAAIGGAFYAGRKYTGPIPYLAPAASPQVVSTAVPIEDPMLKFEQARRDVDRDASFWLLTNKTGELNAQGIQNPLDSNDTKFLYLFGRASLLVGNNDDAARAFEAVLTKTTPASSEELTLRKEAALGLAAISLKSEKERPQALTHFDQMLQKPVSTSSP
jgi:hypothetical protein